MKHILATHPARENFSSLPLSWETLLIPIFDAIRERDARVRRLEAINCPTVVAPNRMERRAV